MIKARDLLKRMTEHLSDWLIMRRNPEASNGGKILLGIAEEVCDIQKAIEEYVHGHFIDYYLDKTHVIDYEHMRIHVGAIDLKHLKIISPAVDVCKDLKMFQDSCNYSYYENGYVYFKTIHVSKKDKVRYMLMDKLEEQEVERIPVWNIFDEFALYVGLERLEEEDNEHLLQRILFQSQHAVNSSTEGIQNAIANLTGIQPKEVIVEKIDENNYFTNDFTGQTLFEQLTALNRDIYRSKRWGVDYWQHDMDYATYLPHAYDIKPGYYQDGIGDNDDLKIAMTRKDEIVHLEVKAYHKDEKIITEYYKKYPIDTETKLKLYKPNENIEPIEVTSKIEAGTLTEVTNLPFKMTYQASRSVCEEIALDKIIPTNTMQIVPVYDFEVGHSYRFKVRSKTPYGNFGAKLLYNNQSLITEKDGFYLDDTKRLAHYNTSLYANQLSYFSEHSHFSHELNGFKLDSRYRQGKLVLPLNNLGGQLIHFDVAKPQYDAISDSALSYKDFYQIAGEKAYSNVLNKDSLFAIQELANHIKFKIEGEAIVFIRNEKESYETHVIDDYFETEKDVLEPKDYIIHIIPANTTQTIKISEISYTHFKVHAYLDEGEIIQNRLPEVETNQLTIDMQTAMSSSPLIHFIWVGNASIENLEYISDPFEYAADGKLDFSGNEVVFDIEDLTAHTVMTLQTPFNQLISLKQQELLLNLENYQEIYGLYADSNSQIVKRKEGYFITLQQGQICSSLVIKGEAIDYVKHYTIDDIVGAKKNARYYISPIVDGFIEAIDYDIAIVKANLKHLYGEYTIQNCDALVPIFETPYQTIQSKKCQAPVQNFYLKSPIDKNYIAYNKQFMYEEKIKDVPVDKNFNPLLPYNEILFYKVTCLTPNATALFYNKKKEEVQNRDYESPYSMDLKTLNYTVNFSLTERLKHLFQEVVLPIRLNKNVMLPDYLLNAAGESLNLKEFLITPEDGFEVYYAIPQKEDIALDPSLIQTEKIILDSKGFKKLKCCHIHEILYCSFEPYQEDTHSEITDYTLVKQLGIMQFSSYFIKNNIGRILYVHYTVQKPSMLTLSTDKLYDIELVPHEAYRHTLTREINGAVGDIEFKNALFKSADFVTVSVKEPGYIATAMPKQEMIHVTESMPKDRITVHKGFYYCDGEEYYRFGDSINSYTEFKNNHIEAHNANHVEDGMLFNTQSENLIRNSLFKTGPLTRLFATDFSELDNINYFKRLNACEQINLWERCNTKMELNKGLYSYGIHFAPLHANTIQFIGMPIEQNGLDLIISFWLKGNVTPAIYVQEKWEEEIHLTLSKPKRLIHFEKDGYLHHAKLPYDANVFYYLMIQGEGVIDDLILCEEKLYDLSLHEKNITKMFMPQFESTKSDKQRLLFNHQKGYTGTTQMLSDGEIVPTSSLSYGYTSLLEKNWMHYAETYNTTFEDDCFVPTQNDAYVLSPVVHITNKAFIKEIVVRANFLSEENTPIIVYMGNSENSLRPINSTISEYIRLDKVEDYLQVRCNLKHALYSLDISARYVEGAIPETYRQDIFESELFDLGAISEYELEYLKFKAYGNAQIYIRVGKRDDLLEDYRLLPLDEAGNLISNYQLGKMRYLQFKIFLNGPFNLEYFDIKDVGGNKDV